MTCYADVIIILPLLFVPFPQHEPVQKYVKDAITRDKAAQSLRPSLGSTQRILRELRCAKQADRKEKRYRVISSHRPDCPGTAAPAAHGQAAPHGDSSEPGAPQDAAPEESGAVRNSSDCCGKFQLFDIVQEEEMVGDPSVTTANPQVSYGFGVPEYFGMAVEWYMWADCCGSFLTLYVFHCLIGDLTRLQVGMFQEDPKCTNVETVRTCCLRKGLYHSIFSLSRSDV